jgi:hypothetical protein
MPGRRDPGDPSELPAPSFLRSDWDYILLRNKVTSGVITEDSLTVRLLFGGSVVVPWVDVTSAKRVKARANQPETITLSHRGGATIGMAIPDGPVQDAILYQLSVRQIPVSES